MHQLGWWEKPTTSHRHDFCPEVLSTSRFASCSSTRRLRNACVWKLETKCSALWCPLRKGLVLIYLNEDTWEFVGNCWFVLEKQCFCGKKKHFKFIWNPLFRRGFACRATSLNFSVSWGNITFWTRNSRKIWNHLPSLLPHQKSHHKVQRTFPQHHLLKGIDRN